jgi:hypothetical protein
MPISPPVQIAVPFATSGLKNAIPANTNNVTGNAGYDAGFGAINMTPKTAGGIPPFGQDFNGIFYDVTLALQFLEAGGSFPFNSTFATAVGGYPIGAVVSRTDGSGLWRNTVANNTTNPETFGAGWQPEDAGITTVAMTNANVTLTALQAARSIIIITGTITANIQLILPTYTKNWTVVNNGTGAFTVTVKTASGSGVALASSSTQGVYGDGTNINSASASGRLLGAPQIFATAGTFTYTHTPGTEFIIVEVQAPGGASGGAPATGAGAASLGAPGGAGAYAKSIYTSAFSGLSVVVGAPGTGVLGGAGNNGGSSTFGGLISCPGGRGGQTAGPAGSTFEAVSNNSPAPTGGNIVSYVGGGGSLTISTAPTAIFLGAAIPTLFGAGPKGGAPGVSPGVGGGPTGNTPSTAAQTGFAGGPGITIIWEYA